VALAQFIIETFFKPQANDCKAKGNRLRSNYFVLISLFASIYCNLLIING